MAGVTVLGLFCNSLLRTILEICMCWKIKNVGTAVQLHLYSLSSTFALLQFCVMGLSTKALSQKVVFYFCVCVEGP